MNTGMEHQLAASLGSAHCPSNLGDGDTVSQCLRAQIAWGIGYGCAACNTLREYDRRAAEKK